jgi:hypothetical protein
MWCPLLPVPSPLTEGILSLGKPFGMSKTAGSHRSWKRDKTTSTIMTRANFSTSSELQAKGKDKHLLGPLNLPRYLKMLFTWLWFAGRRHTSTPNWSSARVNYFQLRKAPWSLPSTMLHQGTKSVCDIELTTGQAIKNVPKKSHQAMTKNSRTAYLEENTEDWSDKRGSKLKRKKKLLTSPQMEKEAWMLADTQQEY